MTIYRLCSLTAALCPDTEKFELILTFRGALAGCRGRSGGQDNSGQQRPGGGGAAEYEWGDTCDTCRTGHVSCRTRETRIEDRGAWNTGIGSRMRIMECDVSTSLADTSNIVRPPSLGYLFIACINIYRLLHCSAKRSYFRVTPVRGAGQ